MTDHDSYTWPTIGAGVTGGNEAAPLRSEPVVRAVAELADPVHVFTKLQRELHAAQVLVSLSGSPAETRRACLEGLALARSVLEDAADALDQPHDGEVQP